MTRRATRPDPWLLVALVASFGLLGVALFGERIAPHEPIYFVVEHPAGPRPYDPGLVFPLGSDVLGRDLLSLVLAGARTTLLMVLLSGLARVVLGVLVASLSWWRPVRLGVESLAELASAVPATIVALLLVKLFVRGDTGLLLIVGALLVTGWAGPYRVIRAELDRLARLPFTQGAAAIGMGRWRLLWRHHLPHLVPVIALNASQQIVASLVLVAELGVLGVAVGVTRSINIEESLGRVITGPVNAAQIPDPSEWGGLLASARTIESLWTTRWLVVVPGLAFALTAVAVAAIGYALARRYARRDAISDLAGPGMGALAVAVLALFLVSSLVPERYAAARDVAAAARAELRPTVDLERAFAAAGLDPVGRSYAVTREISAILQSGPATVSAGAVTLSEPFPRRLTEIPDRERTMRAFLAAGTGGAVEAPLVFAGRGISAADYQPVPQSPFVPRTNDVAKLIRDYGYADDYAGIDVRGKVVLLVRFLGIAGTGSCARCFQGNPARGPSPEEGIANAIKRGAAGVIFVDPALYLYSDLEAPATYGLGDLVGGLNPYSREEKFRPPTGTSGVPVIVLGDVAGQELAGPLGIDLSPFFRFDERGAPRYTRSIARDLGVTARVGVPLERRTEVTTSYVAEVADAPDAAARIVVWSVRRPGARNPGEDVLAAVGRAVSGRRIPLVFVDFDPAVDPAANAKAIREVLKGRLELVIVLDSLDGTALRFTTPHGDLIPALDLYAERAGARHQSTLTTARPGALDGLAPFIDVRTVVVRGSGGEGDLRPDATALLGYLSGRLELGAPELPR